DVDAYLHAPSPGCLTVSRSSWTELRATSCSACLSGLPCPSVIGKALPIVLAVIIGALPGLAHASPPDQTWIAGLYDDADYDDAIVAVTGMIALLDGEALHNPQHGDVVMGLVLLMGERVQATPTLSSNFTRAPPAA